MSKFIIFFVIFTIFIVKINTSTNDVLGCGGFLKSHLQIDFSKVEVKLLTKQGILKDKTTCAPNNGYYFLPIYDKGDYTLELNPPPGWSFSPTKVDIKVDRVNDLCSKGIDINFNFKGFGITGRVESYGFPSSGPKNVKVELKSGNEVRETLTDVGGVFSFSPVYPGAYVISIQHPKWNFLKNKLEVEVVEGNTELPSGSLVVHGYTITGYTKSKEEAVSNVLILLFKTNSENKNIDVSGCDKTPVPGYKASKQPLCHVKSDKTGRFVFGSIPVGNYYVSTFYQNQNIDIEPNKIEFTVHHEDLELATNFNILGFSTMGRIVKTFNLKNPEGIPNVKIFVNDKYATQTDSSGSYKLEKLETGLYKIKAEAENLLFEEINVKMDPNLPHIPDITPNAFKVCGKVDSDQSHTVTIVKIGSTLLKSVQSDSKTGKFCEYLPNGSYEIQVQIQQSNLKNELQFYPISQRIDVIDENTEIILFSQLKAKIEGSVKCQLPANCQNIELLLKSVQDSSDKGISTKLNGRTYQFSEISPGSYKITLSTNRFCWVKNSHEVFVNAVTVTGPTFIQNGYAVKFISSHNTKVSYKLVGDSIKEELEIKEGESTYCLPKDGSYEFEYLGCHSYTKSAFTFMTGSELNEIKLNAVAHSNKICIGSKANYGPVTVTIDVDGEKVQKGPLHYENGCYVLEVLLEPSSNAIIMPYSEIYYFKPPIYSIKGKNDCFHVGKVIEAVKGHVYKGKIEPALPSTIITLVSDDGETLTTETDNAGFYKFPPMDELKIYKITAKKESYQLVGPSVNGDFTAYKLAEVIVEVLDELNRSPLQGTLLSLSGGLSYRSNLQTDEQGKITFGSLNPSEYYLKPMMKEYSFEPSSKIIHVKEGQAINITLIGKRIAYSAFGHVTSLSTIPERNLVLEAVGSGNCSNLSEETTTESDGKFRIRGLKPYCTYQIKTKDIYVQQSIPEFIVVENISKDVKDLNMVVLKPKKQTNVLVRIQSDVPEFSKILILNVYLKSQPLTLIHSIKLDTNSKTIKDSYDLGIIMHLPSIPKDGRTYIIQLETVTNNNFKRSAESVTFVANSTFKYFQLKYSVKSNMSEQPIKQTSMWGLIFMITCLVVAYNISVIFQFINDKFNINLNSLAAIIRAKVSNTVDHHTSDVDIDQIVQNINAVKRKPKRN